MKRLTIWPCRGSVAALLISSSGSPCFPCAFTSSVEGALLGNVIPGLLSNWWGIVIRPVYIYIYIYIRVSCRFAVFSLDFSRFYHFSKSARKSCLPFGLSIAFNLRPVLLWLVLVHPCFFFPAFSQLSCVKMTRGYQGARKE
jgi:hypothetical protein